MVSQEQLKQTIIANKKRIFIMSWFVILPLLIGTFFILQPGPETTEPEGPVDSVHPEPIYFHNRAPSDVGDVNCSSCHLTEITAGSCEGCHTPNVTIYSAVLSANVSFPHHNSSSGLGYGCEAAACHNAGSDLRTIDTPEGNHTYCSDACHSYFHDPPGGRRARSTSTDESSSEILEFLISVLSIPVIIALFLFRTFV